MWRSNVSGGSSGAEEVMIRFTPFFSYPGTALGNALHLFPAVLVVMRLAACARNGLLFDLRFRVLRRILAGVA